MATGRALLSCLRTRGWLSWLAVAACVAVVAPHLGRAGQELAYAVIGFGSAACVVAGVRRHRPARPRAWLVLSLALACSATANTVWGVQFLLDVPGDPRFSAVDVLYFSMYPLLAAGLAAMTERPPGASRWVGMAEAGIVTCTGAALAWILFYDPYMVDAGRSATDSGATAYPILDLMVVAAAVRLLAVQRRLRHVNTALLAMAVLLTAADIPYFLSVTLGGSWSGSALSVMGWLAAFALPGMAALHPAVAAGTDHQDRPAGGWRTGLLHGLLVVLGPAATGYALLRDARQGDLDTYDVVVPLTATAVIAVLLVVRMTNAQRELRHLAEHDALTGLPNRRLLEKLLDSATAYHLLLLDLDGFQDVNDRLGHAIGDDLLLAIADRLRALLGRDDVLARTGGDEFAVLIASAEPGIATVRADLVLETLRQPVTVGGHTLHVTASIGVRPADGLASAARLIGDADLALYAAKAAGKDCAAPYDPALRDRQTERIRTVERLREALRTDELTVHYQPIVDLATSRTVAVEALARWFPPGEPPIGPDVFIPAAEDSGLIVALGEWVLRQACADAAAWRRAGDITLTVNVSPRQLTDSDFTTKVRRSLSDSGLPPTALTLEITEGILIGAGAQSAHALAHLEALRADGIRIAVDDFGTGYSSLAYLRDLPIDTLKIDRSLMPADNDDERQIALVRAVIDLAGSLSLTTVAEGIETPAHAALLHSLGCDRGQGYHFARPMPAGQIADRQARALQIRAA